MVLLLDSPFKRLECTSLRAPPTGSGGSNAGTVRTRVGSLQSSPLLPPPSPANIRPSITRSDTMNSISSGVSNTIRRTSSFAAALGLKSFGNGIAFPSVEDSRASALMPQYRSDVEGISRPPSPNLNFAQYESAYSRPPTPPMSAHDSLYSDSDSTLFTEPSHFRPSDAMEALMEEDMERLRARRRPRRNHSHQRGGSSAPSPSNSVDSSNSIILGLGTGLGVRDVLPLKSTFFDWCCEYFTEPQMRASYYFFLRVEY